MQLQERQPRPAGDIRGPYPKVPQRLAVFAGAKTSSFASKANENNRIAQSSPGMGQQGPVRRRSPLLLWRRKAGCQWCCQERQGSAGRQLTTPVKPGMLSPSPATPSLSLPSRSRRAEVLQFAHGKQQGHRYQPQRVLTDPAPHPLGCCRKHQLVSFLTTISCRHGGVRYPENVILVMSGITVSHPKHQCAGCCGGQEIGH